MNDLCCEIGFKSINHAGEQLCGDHVDVVEQEDGSTIIVLMEPGRVKIDPEILAASAEGQETPVRYGQAVGTAIKE